MTASVYRIWKGITTGRIEPLSAVKRGRRHSNSQSKTEKKHFSMFRPSSKSKVFNCTIIQRWVNYLCEVL